MYLKTFCFEAVRELFLYLMPVLFSMVLVSLDNIQKHLENPFDQAEKDDVYTNVEKFID